MHMNIAMTLRLMITPVTPIVNSTAESARYHESCGSIVLFSLCDPITVVNSQQRAASSVVSVHGVKSSAQPFGSTIDRQALRAGNHTRVGDNNPPRRASVIAPTIAISSSIEVISNGKQVTGKQRVPIERVSPTSDALALA